MTTLIFNKPNIDRKSPYIFSHPDVEFASTRLEKFMETPEDIMRSYDFKLMYDSYIEFYLQNKNTLDKIDGFPDNEIKLSEIPNMNIIAVTDNLDIYKKTIDEDALFYLKSHLRGDHQIIKSELEKLFNFTHDKLIISKQDILQTLSQDLLASGDEMCIFFAQKEPLKFLKEVAKLQDQSKNEVLMIRALIRYYLNIYTVASKLEDGENLDRAIKTLYPPIFFKYIDG